MGVGVITGVEELVGPTVVPTIVVVTTDETMEVTVCVTVTAGTVPEPRLMVMEEVTMLVTVTVETTPPATPHEPNCDWQPPPQKESSLPQ